MSEKPEEKIMIRVNDNCHRPIGLDLVQWGVEYQLTLPTAKHLYKQLGIALAIVKGKRKEATP
jgi:hypothetical protein